jgi:hypothetical protein
MNENILNSNKGNAIITRRIQRRFDHGNNVKTIPAGTL